MAPMATKKGKDVFKSLLKQLSKKKDSKNLEKFATIALDKTPEEEVVHLVESRSHLADGLEKSFQLMKDWKMGEINVHSFRSKDTSNIVLQAYLEDGPFLVDSIWEELHERGLEVRHTFHPVFIVKRDKNGKLIDFSENTEQSEVGEGLTREVLIHLEYEYIDDDAEIAEVTKVVQNLLKEATAVKQDFGQMLGQMELLVKQTSAEKKASKHKEEAEFFKWLMDGNYIFLGYRHYTISQSHKKTYMQLTKKSGLGILRDDKKSSVYQKKCLDDVPPNLKHYYSNKKEFVTITKALTKSPVHRRADMDYIGIKEFDAKGNVIGEHRFLGLLTSRAYTTNPRVIPMVREKIQTVLERQTNLNPQSHNHKALVNILETYPRDELFQINTDDLERISLGVLNLKERQQVRVFIRHSRHELLTTAMVFIPIERMSTVLRRKIVNQLKEIYNAEDVEFLLSIGESRLARLFLKIRSTPPATPVVSDADVEACVRNIARSWSDELEHALCHAFGEKVGLKLSKKYAAKFRAGYRENNPVSLAMMDIAAFENMQNHDLNYLVSIGKGHKDETHLKVFHRGSRINLSQLMPTFDNMGLHVTDENSTLIKVDNQDIWVHDFGVQLQEGQEAIHEPEVVNVVTEALERAWYGELENDELNSLMIRAGLKLREVIYLRAFVAYLQQCVMPYSKGYIRGTLVRQVKISKALCDLFETRFNPSLDEKTRDKHVTKLRQEIEEMLSTVKSLDEDVILRQVLAVVNACLRTNAFQNESHTAPLAFKLRSKDIPNLPKPHPMCEIFVYHNTVEGVHLRGGMVARGGLRWSDRPEDFRTEVLGLVKAQMSKNAVIVPVGSKGGFVLKAKPVDNSREAMMTAVQSAYKIFINGLLCLTDNLSAGKVLKPRNVVCADGDDPYLVVAADKGTATFSDIANGEAMKADYWDGTKDGFWLNDAFASGGSNGYDHKKMGITARGGWECVKHHFRELGRNIQEQEFTVVGIGDMAGDVFGNAMLLSKKTKLVAAFNHMHIFLDPNPDCEKSYKERERLFKNPHLNWGDYDRKLLSNGGDIVSRSEKSITVSKEVQDILGLSKNKLTPNELIQGILRAPVDLLWNGGIGTFVRAASENNAGVGDRANDSIRIIGKELRVQVVGEGGNLGFTQLGRIEYAKNGGRINTDAIDNSAGVNCSDIEVNTKILMRLIQEGTKMTDAQRNKLLVELTDNVGELALEANYRQAQILSIAQVVSKDMIEPHKRLIHNLEKKGILDRAIEFLPTEEELDERAKEGQGLTRPELSVLMAYAKMDLYDTLVQSKLPGEKVLQDLYLYNYFPTKLIQKYKNYMDEHRLKREIVATQVTNELVNRMGMTFMDRMMDETGKPACTITRAFIVAKTLLGAQEWFDTIDSLDNVVDANVQKEMRNVVKALLEGTAFWFLRNSGDGPLDIEKAIQRYETSFMQVRTGLSKHLTSDMKKRIDVRYQSWVKKGVPEKVAQTWAHMQSLNCSADVATIALETGQTVADVMDLHFRVGEFLNLDLLHNRTRSIPVMNNWQRVGSLSIIEQLYGYQKQITGQVIAEKQACKLKKADEAVTKWIEHKNGSMSQYNRLLDELKATETTSHAMLNVALGQLKGLIN